MSHPKTLPTFVVHSVDAPRVKGDSMLAAASAGTLELRIDSRSVRLYPPPMDINDDADAIASLALTDESPADEFVRLLSGPLDDIQRYSRQEASQWLIDMAHDICDPASKRGSLLVWKDLQQQWFPVAPADPLTESIYRYDIPDGIVIGLSKISRRNMSSRSSATGNAQTMRDRVIARDERCWISGLQRSSAINSHIVPKRMGDYVARILYQTFTGSTLNPPLSIFDPRFGVMLGQAVDSHFDNYLLGFRFVSQGEYQCHSFYQSIDGKVMTTYGELPVEDAYQHLIHRNSLHGASAIAPNPSHVDLPPPGLFRWHYLQCVIKKFGHPSYRSLNNNAHFEESFRTNGEGDHDYSTDSNEDWPTKAFDLGRAAEISIAEREERHRSTAQWISTV